MGDPAVVIDKLPKVEETVPISIGPPAVDNPKGSREEDESPTTRTVPALGVKKNAG